jgi:hypothetical protein
MSSQSVYAGTAGTKNFHTGTSSWATTGNATGAPDGAAATVSPAHNVSSDSLDLYNFGFSIPGGSTINGVSATVTAERTGAAGNVEFLPNLGIECGSTVGAFTASSLSGTVITGGSFNTYTTGSSTDLAGLSSQLTVSNINSNVENTGITIGIEVANQTTTFGTANIDACLCTVWYTAGGGSGMLAFYMADSDMCGGMQALSGLGGM